MARASQKRTRHRCLNPHHPRGKPRQASRAPRRLHSTAGHRDRPPLSARFAGSSLRPEKKKGRGTATSPIPMQSLHRALRHHGSRGKLDTPPAVRIRLTPSKREGKAPPPRPCHPRALGGQGGSRGRLDPSLPPPPPPGRLPRFAGSSLGPEKKDEAPPPRPSPSPGPQEPAAATAGWTLAGISAPVCTSTHLCHHRAFRGRGGGGCVCVEPRQARIPAPPPPRGPPAFECRRPPPAAGLRPAPRGERLYPSHRSPTADGACRWLRLSLTPPAPRTHRLGLSGKNRGTAVTNRRKKRAKPPGDTA